MDKGIDQLMDEGVAQLFTLEMNNRKVIGTVGALQYEVIQYRLEHEYGAKCTYENFPVHKAIIDLTAEQYDQLWKGVGAASGIDDFFKEVEQNLYKVKLFFTSEFD